jgi:hypothetical protein
MTVERSESAWFALRDERLARHVESMRAEGFEGPLPTDAEFVRFISPDEWTRVHAQCLREEGVDAEQTPGGGIAYGDGLIEGTDARQAHLAAAYRCEVRYPIHPRYFEPMTPDQIRVIYDHVVATVVPYVRSRGYDVPDAPDWLTYLGWFGTTHEWHPYNLLAEEVDGDALRAMQVECPRHPPAAAIYGGPLPSELPT